MQHHTHRSQFTHCILLEPSPDWVMFTTNLHHTNLKRNVWRYQETWDTFTSPTGFIYFILFWLLVPLSWSNQRFSDALKKKNRLPTMTSRVGYSVCTPCLLCLFTEQRHAAIITKSADTVLILRVKNLTDLQTETVCLMMEERLNHFSGRHLTPLKQHYVA